MRVGKLYEGQVFKNYKMMCEELEMPIRAGNSKKAQLRELGRYCKFQIVGHRITVLELFDSPLELQEKRGRKSTSLTISNSKLALEWHPTKNKESIENIGKNSLRFYWWTCKVCCKTVYDSPKSRLRNTTGDVEPKCPYCALSGGAKLVADYLMRKNIRYVTERTASGLTGRDGGLLRFDFAVLDESNNPLYFIEYDGAQHFSPTSFTGSNAEKEFVGLSIHDRRKNKYCEEHDISLIRVCYFEDSFIDKKLSESIDIIDKGGTVIHRTPLEVSKSDLREIEREIVRQQKEIDRIYSQAEEKALRVRSNIVKLEQRKEALSNSIRDDSL